MPFYVHRGTLTSTHTGLSCSFAEEPWGPDVPPGRTSSAGSAANHGAMTRQTGLRYAPPLEAGNLRPVNSSDVGVRRSGSPGAQGRESSPSTDDEMVTRSRPGRGPNAGNTQPHSRPSAALRVGVIAGKPDVVRCGRRLAKVQNALGHALRCDLAEALLDLYANRAAPEILRRPQCCPRTHEWVEDGGGPGRLH